MAAPRVSSFMDKLNTDFLNDVLEGFSADQKWIWPKYFYDATGVEIYEEIKKVPEYYLPKHERQLISDIAGDLAEILPEVRQVVEYGGGSDVRTETVVKTLPSLTEYLPVDVAIEQLDSTAEIVKAVRPGIEVTPLLGDFVDLPQIPTGDPSLRLGFLPGSTIGNFNTGKAREFLAHVHEHLGVGSHLLIGYDLIKDVDVLLAAYDDAAGVTRRFNLNLIDRINRELSGDLDHDMFWHMVVYNHEFDRIETYLESTIDQTVTIAGRQFHFDKGERLHTEHSHKYSEARFAAIIEDTGWTHQKTWTSENDYYAITLRA